VIALSKAWICGRSLAGIAGSNHAGGMDVRVLWVLCVVRLRSLGRADPSSRRVVPSVLWLCAISKSQQGGELGPVELSNHGGGDEGTNKYEAKLSAIRPSIVITNFIELCVVPFLRCSHLFTTVKWQISTFGFNSINHFAYAPESSRVVSENKALPHNTGLQ
jgi:hypothetical protein